jgi:hypothetical protein
MFISFDFTPSDLTGLGVKLNGRFLGAGMAWFWWSMFWKRSRMFLVVKLWPSLRLFKPLRRFSE